MNRTTAFIYLGLFITIISCSTFKHNQPERYSGFNLPGVVWLDTNFYCDQTEVTNFNWLEYLFWKEKAFGKYSADYKNALPDTVVWLKEDSCLHKHSEYYLRHPAYRDYPVVGITQQQAEEYAQWRSDRVFEYFLIKNNVFQWDSLYDSTNHFTIEKYFNGTYKNIVPNPNYAYYPVYRLPSVNEQYRMTNYMLNIQDSLNNLGKRTKNCTVCLSELNVRIIDITPCPDPAVFNEPTAPVIHSLKYCQKYSVLYRINDNVAELSSEENTLFIDSWKKGDQKEHSELLQKHVVPKTEFQPEVPSSWVGFRCVAEWKKWGE